MDAYWAARVSSASKSYKAALQSRSGMKWDSFDAEMSMGLEEIEVDDDIREEYICPFCSEYFDILGLCCHVDDEHSTEARNGVCPVCLLRVDVDMLAHITLEHGIIFKMQRKRKSRKSGSHSTLSLLRKELREGNLQSLFGGSASLVSSSNSSPDPLLSSFILPMVEDFESVLHTLQLSQNLSRKALLMTFLKEKYSNLPCHSRIRRRRRKCVIILKECCYRLCLMIFHKRRPMMLCL